MASSASIFGIKKYKAVALPAVILSLVCICCAGICVLVDLGGIQRIWRMFTGLNFLSPLAWDMIVITCYLVINLVYLYFMCSRKADPAKVAVVSRFALPVAILVHSVTAWIFGLEVAREAWHTAILGADLRGLRTRFRPGASGAGPARPALLAACSRRPTSSSRAWPGSCAPASPWMPTSSAARS